MNPPATTAIAPVYRLGLLAWALLVLLQLAWHGWLFPARTMPAWLVLGVTVVPLLLPSFAIRNVRRALLWVGIFSLFYFCHGVAEAWSAPGERVLAWAEIVLTVGLIVVLGTGVKRRHAPH